MRTVVNWSLALPDWNERYLRGENSSDEPSPLLVNAVRAEQAGVALDLACGAGRNSLFLAASGWRVTAVDNSTVALDLLRRRAADRGLIIGAVHADLEHDEFGIEPDAYDLICDIHYLQRGLFPMIRRGIRPGGLFIGSIYLAQERSGARPMNPSFLLDAGELEQFFEGWKIEHYREGNGYDGSANWKRSAADIIARRPMD